MQWNTDWRNASERAIYDQNPRPSRPEEAAIDP